MNGVNGSRSPVRFSWFPSLGSVSLPAGFRLIWKLNAALGAGRSEPIYADSRPGDRVGGWKGHAPLSADEGTGQTAVPFGGKYRIIDFVLSNFINSGIYSVYVLTQFRSQSLLQHLSEGWQFGQLLKTQFVIPVPAQMRSPDEAWYQGTADAIYQNINLVEQSDPHVVAIFGGDHIYRMDIASMIEYHAHKAALVTVAAIPVERDQAVEFGVIEAAADGQIVAFHEKNPDAPTMPGDDQRVYASMGNYVFNTRTLLRLLRDDAADESSHHDFGHDILPRLAGKGGIYAYDFQSNRIPGEPPTPSPTGATWEPSTPTTRPTWTCATSSRPSTCTTASGRCARRATRIRPAKFIFDEANRRGRPSTRLSPAGASSRAAWCGTRCWAAGFACTPARWWRIA